MGNWQEAEERRWIGDIPDHWFVTKLEPFDRSERRLNRDGGARAKAEARRVRGVAEVALPRGIGALEEVVE